MQTEIRRSAKVANLLAPQRAFIEQAMAVPRGSNSESLAIYLRDSDGLVFIEDALVPSEANDLMARAPEGIYRTGTAGFLKTKNGKLVVSDERRKEWKPYPAGLGNHKFGGNLIGASMDEFNEEVHAFSLDDKIKYVPKCLESRATLEIKSLGFSVEQLEVLGDIEPLCFHFDDVRHVCHLIFMWRGLENIPDKHSFAYDDKWFKGGYFGAPVAALDHEDKFFGYYSGRQGFVSVFKYKLHSLFINPPVFSTL